ncbi:SdpA family antimicrobial peptide system protein [Salinibacter altiplanensis]|uniref:SdpA family antimicrobial peptide system protein n=1 Tax=Salinibacter altiplanensis TaxID=1803181 RepID=UPI000C9F4629|nr:SdpA family antimicrobial peptide system protein [Salinibacter altiplanensis]
MMQKRTTLEEQNDVEPAVVRNVSNTAAVAIGLVILFLWGTFGAYILQASMPYNPIDLPYSDVVDMRTVIPEGWAFFTRNPREPSSRFYEKRDGTWQSARLGANASPENLFGLSRRGRGQGIEAARLIEQAPDSAWTKCKASARSCLKSISHVPTVENPSPLPTFCGTVGFVRRPPVPWAWNESRLDIHMPGQALKLDIQC